MMSNQVVMKKPIVSSEQAVELVNRIYCFNVTSIRKMISYDDQNFHIQVSDFHTNPHAQKISPEGYTLKITNTEKSAIPHHFDSMHTVMLRLHEKGLSVPVPVKNIEGTTWKMEKTHVLGDDGETGLCGVHLLTFVPGKPICEVPMTKSLAFQWGALLATCHDALQDFSSNHLERKHVFWSLEHVPEIASFMGVLAEDQRALVGSVLEQYDGGIWRHLHRLKKGVIHGDFNENNILVRQRNGGGDWTVDGILDFEDVHVGTYVWDVGVLLAYVMLVCKTMDPLDGAGYAVAGYTNRRTLDQTEMELLQLCIMCRLCQSLVLGAHGFSLDPSNTYLLSSAETGWDRLRQIQGVTNEDLLSRWTRIRMNYNQSGS